MSENRIEKAIDRIKGRKAAADQAPEPAEPIYDYFRIKTDADGGFKDVTILQTGFLSLLRRLGFRRYDVGEGFIITRITDNVIEQIYPHRLREMIVRYFTALPDEVAGCPRDALLEKLHRSLGTLTTDEKLSLLVDMSDDHGEMVPFRGVTKKPERARNSPGDPRSAAAFRSESSDTDCAQSRR